MKQTGGFYEDNFSIEERRREPALPWKDVKGLFLQDNG
jgi:hypothetical protein